jgi:hypothetical protein
MNRKQVLRILKEHSAEIAGQYGVKSLALFGSVARDQASPASDVDLLVEFDRPVGLFGLFALQEYLENLLGKKVFKPLINRSGLNCRIEQGGTIRPGAKIEPCDPPASGR